MALAILIPAAAAVVGLVVYLAASSAKVAEVGRVLFLAGALVALAAAYLPPHRW